MDNFYDPWGVLQFWDTVAGGLAEERVEARPPCDVIVITEERRLRWRKRALRRRQMRGY